MFVVWKRVHAAQPLWYWDEGQRHRRLYRQPPEATHVVVAPRPPPPRLARSPSTARPYTSEADRELLGLGPDFSSAELRAAYYRLSVLFHPDRRGGDEATMKEINAAYGRLRQAILVRLA
jgi:DnaJ-like protein